MGAWWNLVYTRRLERRASACRFDPCRSYHLGHDVGIRMGSNPIRLFGASMAAIGFDSRSVLVTLGVRLPYDSEFYAPLAQRQRRPV
jgi:hypothetical protein